MKPFISIGICFVLLTSLLLVGCTTEVEKPTESEQKESDKGEQLVSDKEGYVEEKGIIVDRIKFGDYTSSGEIIKNKLTKTAKIEIKIYLNDSEEYDEIFEEKVSMAPLLINAFCELSADLFFNWEKLEKEISQGNLTIESDEPKEENPLKGYKVDYVHAEFIDFEDKNKIAECTALGPKWNDIEFKVYRKYDSTFTGTQIGER